MLPINDQNKFDSLAKRRQQTALLDKRKQEKLLRPSSSKVYKDIDNIRAKSVKNCSSDGSIIENSDTETEHLPKKKKQSDDTTNNGPQTHTYFVSPCKENESSNYVSDKKLRIILDILIKAPTSSSVTSMNTTCQYTVASQDSILLCKSPLPVNAIPSAPNTLNAVDEDSPMPHVLSPFKKKDVFTSNDASPPQISLMPVNAVFDSPKKSNGIFSPYDAIPQLCMSPLSSKNTPVTPRKCTNMPNSFASHDDSTPAHLPLLPVNASDSADINALNAIISNNNSPLANVSSPSIINILATPEEFTNTPEAATYHPVLSASRMSSPSVKNVVAAARISTITPDDDRSKDGNSTDMTTTPKKRRKRMCLSSVKSFIDFLDKDEDDQDFSAGSSDLWSNNKTDNSSENTPKKNQKKLKNAKKRCKNYKETEILMEKKKKRTNKRNERKTFKDSGKSYATRQGEVITEKKIKENPCVKGKCMRKCYELSEEKRASLFNHFYKLDSQRRRDWLVRCCKHVPVRRKRTNTPESRRNITYEYYVNDGEDHRPVCQKFLLSTLDITQIFLRYTIQNAADEMAKKDMRKPNTTQKYTEETKSYVHAYIKKLPILPSHYSRRKSNKMYLPQEFKNMANIYRRYLNDCKINKHDAVSENIFREIFKEYNIGVHVPKKYKYVVCIKIENSNGNNDNTEEEKLRKHLEEKKAMYKRFKFHQNLKSSTNDTITTSFDLQKVLNTPHGESMLLYYSRKYSVYNFTFYESTTQDAFCYTWGESEGKRGSNEIATCLLKYLEVVDGKGFKNILFYCDSCSGQNKNKTVLATINHFLKTSLSLEVIQINFLLPGHTYMPVDSVHAVIEREVKRLIVWSPSQWATFFESARKRPAPYHVNVLDHSDFLDLGDLASQTFTPTTLKNIKFKEIKTATFKKKKADFVHVKYSMKENAEEVQVKLFEKPQKNTRYGKGKGKGKGKSKTSQNETVCSIPPGDSELINITIKPLYTSRLPISAPKYRDLIRLCENSTIPKTYHAEYRSLPSAANVPDILPDTDEEDGEKTDTSCNNYDLE